MKKLIGREINVCLKDNEFLSGIFFEHDEDSVYLQSDNYLVITIPRENIKYYTSDALNKNQTVQREKNNSFLTVSVDGDIVSKMEVSVDTNISTCTSEIMDMVYSNRNVQEALLGRVQKHIEYNVGEVNIITASSQNISTVQAPVAPPDGFSMSHNIGANSQLMNPSDMIMRIGGKK